MRPLTIVANIIASVALNCFAVAAKMATVTLALVLLLTGFVRGQDNSDSAMIRLARSAFRISTQKPDSGLAMATRCLQQYRHSGNSTLGGFTYKASVGATSNHQRERLSGAASGRSIRRSLVIPHLHLDRSNPCSRNELLREFAHASTATDLGAIPNIEVVELDVTKDDSFGNAVKQALKKYGQIDVLVNNAGIVGFGVFEAVSIDTQKKIFETNLWGMVRGYQAVLPSMRAKRSGLIINVSSVLGLFSGPCPVPCNMSKFAIQGMTEGVRQEVRRFGIESVTVLPGAFDTGITNRGGQDADRQDIIDAYGLKNRKGSRNLVETCSPRWQNLKWIPRK